MFRPGERVSDRYVVIEQIAEGGMGSLWRAHHETLDVDVALKVLSQATSTPDAGKRFHNEARAIARLRSPNIVQVIDFGEHEGRPFLAMELLRGEDLAKRIARERRIAPNETAHILEHVARALTIAHEAEVVHRDLKPANIFLQTVGTEEVVKVLDFGVAKDLRADAAPLTAGGGVVGTPAYMSPEQVWGEKVGPRADVWSLGVVAFEMLTGKCPFDDETLARIFERIIRLPVPSARALNPELPPAVDPFFERALARDPTARIATAANFIEELRVALGEARSGFTSQPRVLVVTPRTPDEAAPATVEEAREVREPVARAPSRVTLIAFAAGALALVAGVIAGTRASPARPEPTTLLASAVAVVPASSRLPPPAASPPTETAPASAAPSHAAAPERRPAAQPPAPRVDPRFGIPIP